MVLESRGEIAVERRWPPSVRSGLIKLQVPPLFEVCHRWYVPVRSVSGKFGSVTSGPFAQLARSPDHGGGLNSAEKIKGRNHLYIGFKYTYVVKYMLGSVQVVP